MDGFTANRRQARLNADYTGMGILSDSMYNLVMSGIVLYGLVVNLFLCTFCTGFMERVNPVAFIIGYFVCCIAGIIMSAASKNPAISFLGYNLVVVPVGLLLSVTVESYGGMDARVVQQAFLYTAVITFCMVSLSTAFPRLFCRMGGVLFSALIGIILCEVVCMFFGISQIATSWIAAVVFALYIGYDFWRSQQFVKTLDNAVDCALDIYLDIVNLFIRLLEILGRNEDK